MEKPQIKIDNFIKTTVNDLDKSQINEKNKQSNSN